jgi:hypothetical protein
VRVIHKLVLEERSEQTYTLPAGAEVRHVASQFGGDVTLWYEFDAADLHVSVLRTFAVEEGWSYVGTARFQNGTYIFHVYEV